MLAQNFKTASDLEITEKQKQALIKTLVLFETDRMNSFDCSADSIDWPNAYDPAFTGNFNMRFWSVAHPSCGTVACIGGTAEIIGDVSFDGWMNNDSLRQLFCPGGEEEPITVVHARLNKITPRQAATALRNYLTTGEPNWGEILGVELKRTRGLLL